MLTSKLRDILREVTFGGISSSAQSGPSINSTSRGARHKPTFAAKAEAVFSLAVALFCALSAGPALAQQCQCGISYASGNLSSFTGDGHYAATSDPPVFHSVIYDPANGNTCGASSVIYGDGSTESCFSSNCGFGTRRTGPSGPSTVRITCQGAYFDEDGTQHTYSVQSAQLPFVADTEPPRVTITSGPEDNAIVGVQKPLVFAGSLSALSPTTLHDSFSGSTASVDTGTVGNINGSWEIDIPRDALYNFSQSGSPVGLSPEAEPIPIGFVAIDTVGLTVTYSSTEALGPDGQAVPTIFLDTALQRKVYVDGIPPVVSFDQGSTSTITTVKAFSVISGQVTDNFRLGSLILTIKDIEASLTWSSDTLKFVASERRIPLEITVGASSPWSYSGLSDGSMVPGHSYLFAVTAIDSVGNQSTSSMTLTFSPDLSTMSPVPASSPINLSTKINFEKNSYDLQYGGPGATTSDNRLVICVRIAQLGFADLSTLTFESEKGALKKPAIVAGCPGWDYAVQIEADPGQCIPTDRVIAKAGTTQGGATTVVGSTEIKILLPETTVSFVDPTKHISSLFASDPRCLGASKQVYPYCIGDVYTVGFQGQSPAMDLAGLTSYETVSQPLPLRAGLDVCSHSVIIGNVPIEPNNTVGDFVGGYSLGGFPSSLLAQITKSQKAYACAQEVRQHWQINACRVPRQADISHRLLLIVQPPTGSSTQFPYLFSTSRSDEFLKHNSL